MPDSIDYKSPPTESPRPKRPLSKWIILLAIWIVGLIMFAVYAAFAFFLLTRIV